MQRNRKTKHIIGHQLIDDKILDRPSIDIIKNG